jgi:hypothetical protein
MERARRRHLDNLMQRLAEGDDSALWGLYEAFGGDVRAVMYGLVRVRGYPFVAPDLLDELTIDACLELRAVARAWKPNGALPWVWARRRLAAVVGDLLPPPTLPFPEDEPEATTGGVLFVGDDEAPPMDILRRLAVGDAVLGLLVEALGRALPPIDRDLLLTYEVQKRSGDPSPSLTVGPIFGLGPDTVRQRASRARRRVLAVVGAEPRFAPLAGLALFGDADRRTPGSQPAAGAPGARTAAAVAARTVGVAVA